MESFDPAANRWSLTLKPADACPYYVKHNPFGSFEGIVRDQRRWERIDTEAGWVSLLRDRSQSIEPFWSAQRTGLLREPHRRGRD
jgi:hypothetical protein